MLTPAQEEFVAQQRVALLATADARGRPHAVPVCFAYLEGRFYTPVDEKPKRGRPLKRLRNIGENPQVALLLHEYHEDWRHLRWLLVQGEAHIIGRAQEHEAAVAALRRRYPQYASMHLEERPLICITPRKVMEWRWA